MMKVMKLFAFVLIFIGSTACSTLNTPVFADGMGAIGGYDAVAYHTESKPVKGTSAYTYEYNNSNWKFSSEQNLNLFRDDPERYMPQYGGYCAYAMSKNFVVSSDPQAWTIDAGKLYLNYSLGVRKTWLKDIPGYVARADANWQEKITQPVFE